MIIPWESVVKIELVAQGEENGTIAKITGFLYILIDTGQVDVITEIEDKVRIVELIGETDRDAATEAARFIEDTFCNPL